MFDITYTLLYCKWHTNELNDNTKKYKHVYWLDIIKILTLSFHSIRDSMLLLYGAILTTKELNKPEH